MVDWPEGQVSWDRWHKSMIQVPKSVGFVTAGVNYFQQILALLGINKKQYRGSSIEIQIF